MWVGQAAVWCDNPIVCLHSTDWHRQGHGAGMLLRVVWAKGTSAWHRWRCRFPQTPPRTLSIFRPALERNSTGFPRPSMGQNRICSVVCCGPLGWGWPTAMHAAQKASHAWEYQFLSASCPFSLFLSQFARGSCSFTFTQPLRVPAGWARAAVPLFSRQAVQEWLSQSDTGLHSDVQDGSQEQVLTCSFSHRDFNDCLSQYICKTKSTSQYHSTTTWDHAGSVLIQMHSPRNKSLLMSSEY